MSLPVFFLLALAGGLGAGLRFVVDEALTRVRRGDFPLGTFTVNVSGSLALGVVMGLGAHAHLGPDAVAILGAGLLGGFTTFSTASVETMRLGMSRGPARGVAYAVGTAIGAVGAAALGLAAALAL